MEIWKDIDDIDGYKISNYGRVLSSKGNVDRILKPFRVGNYLGVKIGNPQKNFFIHHLVAKYFLNYKKVSRKVVIDHIDNDKTNNMVDNLQIVSNVFNCIKDRKNEFIGIRKLNNNKFQARITDPNGNRISLGCFYDVSKAQDAYNKKMNEYEYSN